MKDQQRRPSSPNREPLIGRFQGSGRGFGFFLPEGATGRGEDAFIPPRQTGGAWDGDTVEVIPGAQDPKRPGRPTVRVTKIIARNTRLVTGTVQKLDRGFWLRPDNDRLPAAIQITGRCHVKNGTKAAVAITSYGTEKTPPLGTLEETFGPADSRAAAVEAILYAQEIHRSFPPEVLEQARSLSQSIDPALLAGRKDLREACIITIDGSSSKDLDDAVSLTWDEQGRRVLGVHIADVSTYVPAGSPLDAEAYDRGTSVYFADQVIPMLPVELSNGICSLNPGEDRLTLTCSMTLDQQAQVVDYALYPSVIRSSERMTYQDCNTLLAEGDPALAQRYASILPMLQEMARLAQQLEKLRRLRGSLDLESSESYILCDETGRAVDVVARSTGASEGLIESFMLLANETVARHLSRLQAPAVYRVHEKPSTDKGENLKQMLSPLHISLKEADNFGLQKVLAAVKGRPEQAAVNMMVLRSLQKARYDVEDLGHFGLAAENYCHFTSPIRRYPDLMVHRCLHALWDKAGENARQKLEKACGRAAERASQREIAAQTAERDIDKLYFAEYLSQHLGETFPVTVSGVAAFGLFVSLPSGVEGLIPTETLPEDDYFFDDTALTLSGIHAGAVYTFGMALEAVCVAADPATGRVEFRLPGQENALRSPRRERPLPTTDRPHKPHDRKRSVHLPKHPHKAGRSGKKGRHKH